MTESRIYWLDLLLIRLDEAALDFDADSGLPLYKPGATEKMRTIVEQWLTEEIAA